jgi:ubiquitin-protein ligase
MIYFGCPNCGKQFALADEYAGRSGRCKVCKAEMIVPLSTSADREKITIRFDDLGDERLAEPGATGARLPLRTRRLLADAEMVRQAFRHFNLIRVHPTEGNPPEVYSIEYHVAGLMRAADGTPIPRSHHRVEIQLTSEYPIQGPKCKMQTPIFHPNIEPAAICVGDYWTPSEKLVDVIIRIGEMITFQAYNLKAPLDGEAAMWADQNAHRLPIDDRDLHPPEDP